MNIENITDITVSLLGVCIVLLLIGTVLLKFITSVYVPFVEERDFIRMELMRSRGNERVHWEHELRRLYVAQIPFIGIFLAEQSRKKSRERRKKFSS